MVFNTIFVMNMKSFIEQFPKQLEEAHANASELQLTNNHKTIQHVAILGLGGSAFGGELVKNYSEKLLEVPITIIRDYNIPKSINTNTLVIASSYSGNTEETLSAVQESIQANAFIVCLTSGGKLLEIAKKLHFPYILFPSDYPPRAAAGFSFISKITILHKLGLIPDFKQDFQETVHILKHFNDLELAHKISQSFYNKIPVIYSSPSNESIAIRLRQQIEENAKQLCWHHVIPEMNHNELVGWELPLQALQNTHVLIIRDPNDHPKIQLRMDFVQQKLASKNVSVTELHLIGNNKMAKLIYGLHLSDWVSYQLALLNNVDPLPVKVIDELKNSLAAK